MMAKKKSNPKKKKSRRNSRKMIFRIYQIYQNQKSAWGAFLNSMIECFYDLMIK